MAAKGCLNGGAEGGRRGGRGFSLHSIADSTPPDNALLLFVAAVVLIRWAASCS